MNAYSFLENVFYPNLGLYVVALLISQLFFLPFYLKRVRSIIDPMLKNLIFVGLANAVPVLLFLTNNVSWEIFSFFLCAQILFWTIFYINSSRLYPIKQKKKIPYRNFDDFFFKLCFALYLITTLYSYALNGIPLLNDSRFEQTIDNSSGILGLLSRLSSSVSTMVNIYIIYLIKHKRYQKGVIPLIVVLIFGLLGGSKGFILNIAYSIFFYFLYYENYIPKIKKTYLLIGILTPITTIIISGVSSDINGAFGFYMYRLLANGDMYWNAYPDDVINSLQVDRDGIANMTYFLWGPFRHIFGIEVNEEKMMTTIGADIFEMSSGFYPDSGAPNSPFTLVLWVYYRWWGLIGVALLAWLGSTITYFAQNKMSNTLPDTCFKALLFYCGIGMFGDIYLFFNGFFGLFLFYFIYKTLHFTFVRLSK